MDELYKICHDETKKVYCEQYNIYGSIRSRNKTYDVTFCYDNEDITIELYPVNADTSEYINDIALWRMESYIQNMRMRDFF